MIERDQALEILDKVVETKSIEYYAYFYAYDGHDYITMYDTKHEVIRSGILTDPGMQEFLLGCKEILEM